MVYAPDPALHDEINLRRLVRRLEKSIAEQDWDEPRDHVWIRAQGTLQKVKYAKKLLKTVDSYDMDPTPKKVQQLNDIRMNLERIESFAMDTEKRTAPIITRPAPILPHIPKPPPRPLDLDMLLNEDDAQPQAGTHSAAPNTDDLLPADTPAYPTSASFSFPTPMTLITPSIPSSSTTTAVTTGAAPRFLQNSSALQQELSDQLAQMATQLKRNALHFSDTLVKDQAVVEETQQKLEGNFDTMQKERIRLRDHSGKSSSTTCLVFFVVVTATLLVVLMAYIIRFT